MSSDTGIYILRTLCYPKKQGNMYVNTNEYEYRVAWAMSIEDVHVSDLYIPIIFGSSLVYNYEDAMNRAIELSEEHGYTEYGICAINLDKYYPNITAQAARYVLDVYVGCKPLDLGTK